ncbi:MAG TPA: hypothetical protein VK936_11695 [Longimicrobiales bacterium]|nr:hypothetical protein [Longimicrobiales bacterium]
MTSISCPLAPRLPRSTLPFGGCVWRRRRERRAVSPRMTTPAEAEERSLAA